MSKVKGTGPDGRIIRADVEGFKGAAAGAATSTSSIGADSAAAAEYTDTPVSNMRKVIGTRLTASKTEIPHYYVTVDIDMGRVLQLREVFNKTLEEKGAKLSVNDFIVKASSLALRDVPEANSAWLGDQIRQSVALFGRLHELLTGNSFIPVSRHHKADICVAVSTPTGLITPIVKNVGAKGLSEISAETKALAKKARDGKLAPHEYQVGAGLLNPSRLG